MPFCGRQRELAQLLQFWQQTPGGHGWRSLLIEGEAGSGKSSLLQQVTRLVEDREGAVIRLSLGGELNSTGLMRALVHLPGLLGRTPPEANVDSALTALRRLLRLRPTLLLLDRAENIDGDELQFLLQMLDQLRAEACSMVLAGRSFMPRLRSVLSDTKVDDLHLGPLHEAAVREIWKGLFSNLPDDAVCESLHRHCVGHPGTLKLVLRDLLKAKAIVYDAGGHRYTLNKRSSSFEQVLSASVSSQVDLLLQELNQEQRSALHELACLGYEFSRRAALELLGEERRGLLALLLARGVLRPGDRLLQPICAVPGDDQSLAFNHALLACHLSHVPVTVAARLVPLLDGSVAVYHTTPWKLLLSYPPNGLSPGELQRFHEASLQLCVALERGPRNAEGVLVCDALLALLLANEKSFDATVYHRLRCAALVQKLYLMKTQAGTTAFGQLAELALEMVRAGEGPEFRRLELSALLQMNRHVHKLPAPKSVQLRAEISALVEAHPGLRSEMPWLIYLGDQGLLAWGMYRESLSRWVDHQLRLTLTASANKAFCDEATWRVGSTLIPLFDTPDELAERREQFQHICALSRPEDAVLPGIRLHYHFSLGELPELLNTWEHALELWLRRGFRRNIRVCGSWLLGARFLVGDTPQEVEAAWETLSTTWRVTGDEPRRIGQLQPLITAALLTGAVSWIHTLVESDPPMLSPETFWIKELIALEAGSGDADKIRALLPVDLPTQECPPGNELLREAIGHWLKKNQSACKTALAQLLARPVLRLEHLVLLRGTARLLQASGIMEVLQAEFRQALLDALLWCNERSLGTISQCLLIDFGPHLSRDTRDQLKETELSLRKLQRLRNDLPGLKREEDKRIELRLLGRFEIHIPGHPVIRPRGNRLRTLLGLLAGNDMLRRPLDRREFGQIASGEESVDRARNILAIAVHRLREQLGQDAILTDGDTPRLNEDLIRVDLLEAHRMLDRARTALRARELLRAKLALMQCLDLVGEETPFPGLYDVFFEALRDDFAARQRRLLLELVSSLAVEDPAGALSMLNECDTLAREDDELRELRGQVLKRLGQSAELVRPDQVDDD